MHLVLLLEDGIPELVDGDMTKYRQLIYILLNYSVSNVGDEDETTASVRCTSIDSKQRYSIECRIDIPKVENRTSFELIKAVFDNSKLALSFYVQFKKHLNQYDLGLLI